MGVFFDYDVMNKFTSGSKYFCDATKTRVLVTYYKIQVVVLNSDVKITQL